jgi:hypothetical protein
MRNGLGHTNSGGGNESRARPGRLARDSGPALSVFSTREPLSFPEEMLSSTTVPRAQYDDTLEPAPEMAIESVSRDTDWRPVLLGVLLLSAGYVYWHLGTGWMPFDDGALAQSAERLIQGQLPHRDFDEIYTGGLTYLNASAFRLLGTTLWTLRLVLFAVFVAWVPAVFYIATRFVRAFAAAGIVLLAVVWSLPNYSAAMPSWYNLFLATFGVVALFRFLEVGGRRWLVAAGIAGGLSFLVKVVGLYYVAGVLLFLVFQAHALSRSAADADAKRGHAYAAFVSISLLLFVAALWSVVRRQLHAPEFVQFVLPGALVAALLVRNEWTEPAGTSRARFVTLARLLVPFLVGVALPIALFLIPYALAGALGAFVNGVFVLPMRRFSAAFYPGLPLATMLALVPFAVLAAAAHRVRGRVGRRETVLLAILLLLVLRASGGNAALYRDVWYAARSLLPVLAIIGVVVLWRARAADTQSPLLRARTMLLLAVTTLCSLVQFPFSVPNYFCYVAPLVALTALALYSYMQWSARIVPGLLIGFLVAFSALRNNGNPLQSIGFSPQPPRPMATLALGRGGIQVPKVHAEAYEVLVPMLRAHARGGYTWASPDTPEIYFLSGLRNPTRSLFEFFEDSTNGTARVLRTLDAHAVTAVVLNGAPSFSPPITRDMFLQLAAKYPHARNIGPFQLRWRE